jgi:hypothetical protein
MSAFDYGVEAGLFSAKGMHSRPKSLEYRRLKYRRFVRAAEAIRFAIEDLPSNMLGGCSLEVAEDMYVGRHPTHILTVNGVGYRLREPN